MAKPPLQVTARAGKPFLICSPVGSLVAPSPPLGVRSISASPDCLFDFNPAHALAFQDEDFFRSTLSGLLERMPSFCDLSAASLTELASLASAECEHTAGITEGDCQEFFDILLFGRVSFSIHRAGTKVDLGTRPPGFLVGFLEPDTAWAASVSYSSDAVVARFSLHTFLPFVEARPLLAASLRRRSKGATLALLTSTWMSYQMDSQILTALAFLSVYVSYTAGLLIQSPGVAVSSMTLVVDGVLELSNLRGEVLRLLRAGDSFDAAALFENLNQPCRIKCKEPCLLLRISSQSYVTLANIIRRRETYMCTKSPPSLRMATCQFVKSEQQASLLVALAEFVRFQPGEIILRVGDPGDVMFVILFGEVKVLGTSPSGDTVVLAQRGAGDIFGELALVQGTVRMATVQCSQSGALLLAVTADSFHSVVKQQVDHAGFTQMATGRISSLVGLLPVFEHLDEDELSWVVALMKPRQFEPHEVIIRQGEIGDTFFLILQGSVEVLVTRDGTEVVLATRHEGDCFGEIAVLQHTPRLATVRAQRPVLAMVLSRDDFNAFLHLVPGHEETYAQMCLERTAVFLQTLPLFSDFSDDLMVAFAALFKFIRIEADTTVFEEGEIGDTFYVVVSGAVDVVVDNNGSEVVLATRRSGDVFGEVALLQQMPRSATVRTTERSIFATLVCGCFRQFLRIAPQIREQLNVYARDRVVSRLQQVPLFSLLDVDHLERLSVVCDYVCFKAGDKVIVENEMGTDFFVIMKGTCRVVLYNKDPPVVLAERSEGSFFGEIALLQSTPRIATVEAKGKVTCLRLSQEVFWQFLLLAPQTAEMMNLFALDRVAELLRAVPLLRTLCDEHRRLLARHMTFQRFFPGDTIVRQHDVGTSFYIILHGAVNILHFQTERGTHEFFGEIALLYNIPRTSTIEAIVDTLCFVLEQQSFVDILKVLPDVRTTLEAVARERYVLLQTPSRQPD